MKGNMEERAVLLARYMVENEATVRAAAGQFGVSKSRPVPGGAEGAGPQQGGTAFAGRAGHP